MPVTYDEHAEFQIACRGLDKAWIEAALDDPDVADNPSFVVTAYFDRTRPCA